MYYIDYGTMIDDETYASIEEAEKSAEEGMTYTQEHVRILDENKNQIAISYWRNGKPQDEGVLVQIGSYGYYSEWVEF